MSCWPRLTTSRWAVLFAVLVLESIGGNPYVFSVYSVELQRLFSWTNAQIAGVGAIGNVGLYLSLNAGLFFDARGPAATVLVGAAVSLAGYALLWASSAGALGGSAAAPAPPVALVAFASFALNHGAGWLDTAAVAAGIAAFPGNRGFVVGLLKSLFGLSASLLTLSYTSLFRPRVVDFLLFLAATVAAVAVAAAPLLRLVPAAEAREPISAFERRKLGASAAGVLLVAAYVAVVGVLQSRGTLGTAPWLAGLLLPLLLAQGLLTLPDPAARVAAGAADANAKAAATVQGADGFEDDEADGAGAAAQKAAPPASVNAELSLGEEAAAARPLLEGGGGGGGGGAAATGGAGATLLQGLLSLDLLLFCAVFFAGTGAGLTVINQLGALTKALGADKDGQDVFVILLSVSNCLGRLVVGVFSDVFARRAPRPFFFLGSVGVMVVAQLALAFADLRTLYAGVILSGAAYGSFWSLGPSIIADRFGVKSFASLYNTACI